MFNSKLKVIYVLGHPYSGSTLFGLALGTHKNIANMGEANFIPYDYSDNAKCTCQSLLKHCPVWRDLDVSLLTFNNELNQVVRHRLDQRGGAHKLPLIFLSVFRVIAPEELTYYQSQSEGLFVYLSNKFKENSEVTYLLDLSKSPERLEVLLDNTGFDVYCIYLKRNALSVYDSSMKRPKLTRSRIPFKALRESFWLALRSFHHRRIFRKVPGNRKLTVDWDSFVMDRNEILQGIEKLLEISPFDSNLKVDGVVNINEQHVFVGNRWLFKPGLETVKIQNISSESSLSFIQKLSFHIFNFWQ